MLFEPNGTLQVGQVLIIVRQDLQTRWPFWHWRMGGRTYSKHTGHSKSDMRSLQELALALLVLGPSLDIFESLSFECPDTFASDLWEVSIFEDKTLLLLILVAAADLEDEKNCRNMQSVTSVK